MFAQRRLRHAEESAMELRFRVVKTSQGYTGFVASPRGLRRVYLPSRSAERITRLIRKDAPDAVEDRRLMPGLAAALKRYFAAKVVDFDVPLDCTGWTPFAVDAWRACRQIGYGQTRSYKDLAERLGRPGGGRAVGTAMRRNPCPIVVPCHRVIKSNGALGGFTSPGGVSAKRALLEMEAAALPV
jgi:methylated-DNA-[protein]-cysteine S-methyltransferase